MTDIKIKISPQNTQSFRITSNKEFDIKDGFVECEIGFRPVQISKMDTLYIFIDYNYYITSMTKNNDLKLEVELIKPFELSPMKDITPLSIYSCVLYCHDKLENALRSILDINDFALNTTPFEELEARLKAIIAAANSGEFSLGQ